MILDRKQGLRAETGFCVTAEARASAIGFGRLKNPVSRAIYRSGGLQEI
jgi:hypothetical protein